MLRQYQIQSINEIRNYYSTDQGQASFEADDEIITYDARRRVILQLSTGAGKTMCFCTMLKACHEKGSHALMVVRGAKLVHQASERLKRENVPHGIYQANKTKDNHHLIQVCSIDTLYRRKVTPPADMIVVDECHLTGGSSYQWLTTHENYKNSFFLGVSATPFSPTGLGHVGSGVIYPITIKELIAQQYLVGAKYTVPHKPNLKGVKTTRGGDYSLKELEKRLNEDDEKSGLHGCLKSEWKKLSPGTKCLLFAVSRAHARELRGQLESVGARCGYIDGNTPPDERDHTIARLESGNLDVICSVGVLTTGVDIPSLNCLLVCRPTASHNMWIQILGRGTRPFPGKTHFKVIDLAGNTLKLGPIEAELIGQIEPTKKKNHISNMTMCENCYAAFHISERLKNETHWVCPACKHEMKRIATDSKGREIENTDGSLIEYEPEQWEIDLPNLIDTAKRRGYKKGYVFHHIKTIYGNEIAELAWKRVKNLRRWPIKVAH